MKKALLTTLLTSLLVTSAASAQVNLDDVESILHDGKRIYDIAESWGSSSPKASRDFKYRDTRSFDMQLHRSMSEKYSTISVEFDDLVSPTSMPERLEPWFSTIKKTKGDVMLCTINDNEFIFRKISNLIYKWVSRVDKFVTYAPAAQYDAEILVYSFDPDEVVSIEFLKRNKGGSQRENCKRYKTSKP